MVHIGTRSGENEEMLNKKEIGKINQTTKTKKEKCGENNEFNEKKRRDKTTRIMREGAGWIKTSYVSNERE